MDAEKGVAHDPGVESRILERSRENLFGEGLASRNKQKKQETWLLTC